MLTNCWLIDDFFKRGCNHQPARVIEIRMVDESTLEHLQKNPLCPHLGHRLEVVDDSAMMADGLMVDLCFF